MGDAIMTARDLQHQGQVMAQPAATKLSDEQYAVVQHLADDAGMEIGVYLREVVLRSFVESRGLGWPVANFGKRGGVRPGAGYPKGKPRKTNP